MSAHQKPEADCPLSSALAALSASLLARAATNTPLSPAEIDGVGRSLAETAVTVRRVERFVDEMVADAQADELARAAIHDLPRIPESALIGTRRKHWQ